MRRLSTIELLPPEQRQALITELISRNFFGWDAITQWANAQGMPLSKSAIHRFGSALRKRVVTLEAETVAAQISASDEPEDITGILITLGRLEVQKSRLLQRIASAIELEMRNKASDASKNSGGQQP